MTSPEAWLRRQTAARPQETALIVDGRRESFAALDRRVDGLASRLTALGAVPGRALGGLTQDMAALVLLALAAPRAGAALLPVNPKLAPTQIAGLFARTAPAIVLCDTPPPPPRPERWAALAGLQGCDETPDPRSGAPGAVHLIIATSGSTGVPKGTMLTGDNLAAAVRASRRRLPVDPGDVWLGCLPTYHIGGLSVVFRCLEAGATALLHRRFDATAVAADLEDGAATHISLVPAMLAQLLDIGCRPSARLRCALIGGAGLPTALAARAAKAGWPIHPSYGMSEAGSQVATCDDIARWSPGMAGEPLPGLEIGTTADGRIRVRGAAVMAGYANPTLAPGDGLDADGWFETSDLGGLNADGQLEVLGRADDMLISGGENVHPVVVENLAGRCPGVEAVGIAARPDPAWGDLLVAVVVGPIDEATFLAWCRDNIPSHQRPRAVVKAEALPLTVGGKPDRAALRRMAAPATNTDKESCQPSAKQSTSSQRRWTASLTARSDKL